MHLAFFLAFVVCSCILFYSRSILTLNVCVTHCCTVLAWPSVVWYCSFALSCNLLPALDLSSVHFFLFFPVEEVTLAEQVRRIKNIEAIESDSFVPQAFKSSRDTIKVRLPLHLYSSQILAFLIVFFIWFLAPGLRSVCLWIKWFLFIVVCSVQLSVRRLLKSICPAVYGPVTVPVHSPHWEH